MARDHARIRLDIWADEDWRALPSMSQWLYMHLLTSPSLNFCGVTDWRPARIAALASDMGAADVEYAAAWLEADEFVVIDRVTEEALVRSFVKHDGLLKSENVTKALVKSHQQVASSALRAVVVGQLARLREANPSLPGWKVIGNLMEGRSLTPSEAVHELPSNPSTTPSDTPSTTPFRVDASLLTPYSSLPSPGSAASSDYQPSVKKDAGKRATA